MVILQSGIQAVNHLLERFHFICFFHIFIIENGEGQADNIFDCFSINSKLCGSVRRELQVLVMHLSCSFHDVDGVIGNSFEIADAVQDHGKCLAVLRGKLFTGKLHQICAEGIFKMIHLFLKNIYIFRIRLVVGGHQVNRSNKTGFGQFCHFCGCNFTLLQSKSRAVEETGIEHLNSFVCFFFRSVRNGQFRKFDQSVCKREQDQCCENIEAGVNDCDAGCICRGFQEWKMYKGIDSIEENQEKNSTDDIKIKVNHCGTACIAACTDGGEQCGDTCTDILSHDDRDRYGVADGTGCAECLKNTDRSRGTLDHGGQNGSGKNTEHRN